MGIEQALIDFFTNIGIFHLTIGNVVMILVGFTLVYLAIKYEMEPLLLLPIGISAVLVNLPLTGILSADPHHLGLFYLIKHYLIDTEVVPLLIFFGLGAMTDFGPMIADPKTALLGAAAQIGVFIAMLTAVALGFNLQEAASIGIIGGADGPTTIYLTTKLAPHLLGATAVAAYSYMSLVPIIQPPVIKALTTSEERKIRMEQLRPVSKREKVIFPIASMIIIGLLVPSAAPLVGMLMIGNLFRESGVVERLSKAAREELMNIVTIFLGLGVGSTMQAESFLTVKTLMILGLGVVAFASATAGGVLLGKLMMKVSGGRINPMIGAAGVSAVPMSARVVQKIAAKEDPGNFILMHAMGPNVAGVIGTAVAAGVLLSVLG
ncbi:sodium ion-translocating decarboxylase subunit beta [Palaeococcus sp. (in: euryarchaeotes)]